MNYGFSVIPGLTIKPYAQYIVAPSNDDFILGSSQPNNAWVVGVQFAINFTDMFAFPQFVAH